MSIYDKWKNAKNTNMLFIASEGFGTSTQLKECYSNIINNHEFYIPVYIDLADFEITEKDEESIFDYVLNNYFGEFPKDCGVNHLKQMLKHTKNYKYVFLIDHFEISINKNIYPRTKSEILQLIKYETCSVIVASTFYDEATFKSFKYYELTPLDKESILEYLKNKITVIFDVNAISEPLFNVLSVPRNLKEFAELVDNKHDIIAVLNIKYDYDLIKNNVEYIADNKSDVNECLMKMAYYCNINNTKYFDNSQLEKLFDPSKQNLSFIDEFKRAFKNKIIVRYKDGKPYVLESKIEQLSRISKRYGIGILKQISTDIFCFRFSSQVYIDYYASEYIYRLASKGNWLCLDKYILNDQTSRILAYRFLDNKKKIIEMLKIISDYNRNSDLWVDKLSFNESKYIVLTTNLVNIMYWFDNTFENIDLSYLDLRLCNFIGKNCCGTQFNNSLFVDECFIPVEPENPNIFSISVNGKYFITGDKNVINIRGINHNKVFHRLFSDDGNEFISANSLYENTFSIVCKNNILLVKIDNEFVTEFIKPLDESKSLSVQNINDVSENILTYGDVLCVENNFVLIKSTEKSYYGKSYLLFNLETESLLSCYKINSPVKIEHIVQDGDEIEFLFSNYGKPLKSICYNEKTEKIYYKQYPSMIGRGVEYKNGNKIYFDTDNIDSYLKYYFYDYKLQLYNCNEWLDVENEYNFKIDDINDEKNHIYMSKGNSYIITKNYFFNLFVKGCNNLFYGNHLTHASIVVYDNEFTIEDYWSKEIIGLRKDFVNNKNNKYSLNLNLKDTGYELYCFSFNNINITKNNYNEYLFLLGNVIQKLCFDNDTGKKHLEFLYRFKLNFTDEYLFAINNFPWKKVIMKIVELMNLDENKIKEAEVKKYIRKVTTNILKIILKDNNFYNNSWEFVFSCFLFNFIHYNFNETNIVIDDKDIIEGIKNWCFPCDNGVVYYNGQYTCYLRKNKSGNLIETKFIKGAVLGSYRDGVHYGVSKDFYCSSCFYELYDIFKDYEYNSNYAPRIPIYDLYLKNAFFYNVKGLSGLALDIVEKQTEIDTHYLSFEN